MAGENGARLITTLEARVNKFEKDLARANGTARREFGAIEKRSQQMANRLETSVSSASTRAEARLRGLSSAFNTAAGSLKAGLAGFAVGALAGLNLAGVKSSIADLAKLNDVAERTGASAKFLQAFAFGVRQSGGEAADAAAGMQKFSINVSKAAAGGGDLAKVFEANGVAITDAAGKMRPIEDLLGDFADLVKNAGNEQDQLNLATMAFGRGAGPALVLALAGGRKGLEEMTAQATKAGAVLGDSLVKKAAELDDKFAELEDTIGGVTKALTVEFAGPAVAAALEVMLGKLREMRDVLDAIRNMDLAKVGEFLLSRTGPGALYGALKPTAATEDRALLDKRRAEIQANIAATETLPTSPASKDRLQQLKKDLADVEASIKRINDNPLQPVDYAPSRAGLTAGGNRATIVPSGTDGADGGANAFSSGDAVAQFVRRVVAAESGGKADAKNPNSTATGAGQFIESTWLALFRKHYPEQAASMGESAILALRNDADISKVLIEDYAKENATALRNAGVAVTEANLHLAHFLVAGDAAKVLKAPRGTPLRGLIRDQSIDANKSVLGGGRTTDDAIAYADRRATGTRLAAGDKTDAETEADKRASAIKRVMEALGLEAAEIGKTAEQQRVLQELQAAGVDLNTQEGQAIQAKVAELYKLKEASDAAAKSSEDLKKRQAEFSDIGRDATKGFVKDLLAGKSAADAFSSALSTIAERLTDMILNQALDALFGGGGTSGGGGGGLFGSFLGSIFGGGRAKGGALRPGKIHLVGEEGPELVKGSGTVIPNAQTMRALSAPPPMLSAPRMQPQAAMMGRAGKSELHFHNAPPVKEEREKDDGRGNRRTDVVFAEAVGSSLSAGPAQKTMRTRYGVKQNIRQLG